MPRACSHVTPAPNTGTTLPSTAPRPPASGPHPVPQSRACCLAWTQRAALRVLGKLGWGGVRGVDLGDTEPAALVGCTT